MNFITQYNLSQFSDGNCQTSKCNHCPAPSFSDSRGMLEIFISLIPTRRAEKSLFCTGNAEWMKSVSCLLWNWLYLFDERLFAGDCVCLIWIFVAYCQHQQQVVTAVERAKQVTMTELNAIVGVSKVAKYLGKIFRGFFSIAKSDSRDSIVRPLVC